jgi:hypothetical protein
MAYSRAIEGVKDAQAVAAIFRRLRLALVRDQHGVTTIARAQTDLGSSVSVPNDSRKYQFAASVAGGSHSAGEVPAGIGCLFPSHQVAGGSANQRDTLAADEPDFSVSADIKRNAGLTSADKGQQMPHPTKADTGWIWNDESSHREK